MCAILKDRSGTAKDKDDWEREAQAWGLSPEIATDVDDDIELLEEHQSVINWWLSIPDFLKFNQSICLGMNVCAVDADARLSGRVIDADDYDKLKIIATTCTREINNAK